jgi:hypothetical protein
MSRGLKYSNVGTFQPVDKMNPIVRAQQYNFNGRIFLEPNPTPENFQSGNDYMDSNLNRMVEERGNGKIYDYSQDEVTKPYDLFKGSNQVQETDVSLISNIVVPNSLSRTFFSNENIERLQHQIIQKVLELSNNRIKVGKQSYQELQVVMKSIYLQYGRNLPYDIEGQVIQLNKYVIDECANIVKSNAEQYNKYIQDITSPIPVMPRSQNVSNKGYKFGDFSSLIPSTLNTM